MISPRADFSRPIRFGTRGSALALVQTDLAIARFRAVYPDWAVEARVINTQGDLDKQSPLTEIGGRGVFTSALEFSMLAGEIDAAVHSAKDLPTALHPDAPVVAYPDRADPRDVLVSRHGTTLERLPRNPVIGTSSRRRAVQIVRLRPDARIVDLRGNIDTRLRKAAGAELDAVVLAGAGLHRMGWEERITQVFSIAELTPSPAQGALAIQARRGSDVAAMLKRIDDAAVAAPVGIERAFLGALGVGCAFPVGAHATLTADGFRLVAMIADEAGERIVFADELLSVGTEAVHAADLAARVRAEVELDRGAELWNGASDCGRDLPGVRVVVTRPRRQAEPLVAALRERGANPLRLPMIRIEPVADSAALDAMLREVEGGFFDWLVFTSANAVDVCAARMAELGLKPGNGADVAVAAVGPTTAAAAEAAGWPVRLVAEIATAEGLAAAMIRAAERTARVLYPRSAIGRDALPRGLRDAGMNVAVVEAYRTLPEEEIDRDALECVRRGEIDLITFSSPSSVRHFLALLGSDYLSATDVPVVCAGPATGRAANDAGFTVVASASGAGVATMVDSIADLWRTETRRRGFSSESRLVGTAASAGSIERSGD
jgi:hydroxymethylbilane synthase